MSHKFKKPKPLLVDRNNETLVEDKSDEERPFRLAICVPCRDDVKASFMADLVDMVGYTALTGVATRKLEIAFLYQKGTLISSQRHQLVIEAMKKQVDGILWLDADMRFPKDTIYRLLSHGKQVVAANYSTRAGRPSHPVAFTGMDLDDSPVSYDHVYTTPESTGLEKVDAVGMGVMFTHIDVFMGMQPPAFLIPWHPKFGGYEGEDVYFCGKSRKANVDVWIDHDLSKLVKHCGEHEYDIILDAFVDKEDAQEKHEQKRARWRETQAEAAKLKEAASGGDDNGTHDSGEPHHGGIVVA